MLEIKNKNKIELFNKGWTEVSLGITDENLNKYKQALIEMLTKAKNTKYPFKRYYFPHIRDDNIAAIEAPFNSLIINSKVKEFFEEIKLGNAIKDLMNWDEVYLQLARLFTMKNYKYRGHWHRDFYDWDGNIKNMTTIQVALYVQDQEGFRIFKPYYDSFSKNKERLSDLNINSLNNTLPLNFPPIHFDEIKGKKGTALFFAPGLLHQGNSYKNRLDFHLRFSKYAQIQVGLDRNKKENYIYKKNGYQDFNVYNPFTENFNLEHHDLISKMNKPPFMKKVKGSINYYTGIFNIIKYFRSDFNILRKLYTDKNIKVSLDLKSNTIFQN